MKNKDTSGPYARENVTKPNFLIVGAARSGTTSLWYYLRQHPEIFMPKTKELRFLASGSLLDNVDEAYKYQLVCKCPPFHSIEDYYRAFRNTDKYRAIGEASTHYLFTYRTTIPVIQKYIGDPKIIIILRNPVDRAFSAYNYMLEKGSFPYHVDRIRTFEECLDMEDTLIQDEPVKFINLYKAAGFYYQRVKSYVENFSEVKICLHDDLRTDPISLVNELCTFLGVGKRLDPKYEIKQNISPPMNNIFQSIVFSRSLRSSIAPVLFRIMGEKRAMDLYSSVVRRFKTRVMDPETRKYLAELYRVDVENLQNLLGRDLSHWIA